MKKYNFLIGLTLLIVSIIYQTYLMKIQSQIEP